MRPSSPWTRRPWIATATEEAAALGGTDGLRLELLDSKTCDGV